MNFGVLYTKISLDRLPSRLHSCDGYAGETRVLDLVLYVVFFHHHIIFSSVAKRYDTNIILHVIPTISGLGTLPKFSGNQQ